MPRAYFRFGNNHNELKSVIIAWIKARPADKAGYTDPPNAGFGLYAKFVWPKSAWTPMR